MPRRLLVVHAGGVNDEVEHVQGFGTAIQDDMDLQFVDLVGGLIDVAFEMLDMDAEAKIRSCVTVFHLIFIIR